jgi:16S rRNA (guanine527-N7)-methyltransferase
VCLDRPPDPLPTRVESLPDLPPEYGHAPDAALSALTISLSAGERATIDGHVRLLLAWNAAINLTSIRNPPAIAVRHVADSLLGLAVLRTAGIGRFIDLGSGGGFPGLPLAVALPADRALLVDSVGKKARFLDVVATATGLADRVVASATRAETLARARDHRERWPAVTARAVAALAELVELAFPLLRPGGLLLAWKSGDPLDRAGLGGEIEAAERAIAEVGDGTLEVQPPVAQVVVGDVGAVAAIGDHRLVVIRRRRRPISGAWPRDPAARARRPW